MLNFKIYKNTFYIRTTNIKEEIDVYSFNHNLYYNSTKLKEIAQIAYDMSAYTVNIRYKQDTHLINVIDVATIVVILLNALKDNPKVNELLTFITEEQLTYKANDVLGIHDKYWE